MFLSVPLASFPVEAAEGHTDRDVRISLAASYGHVLGQDHRFGNNKNYFCTEFSTGFRVKPGAHDIYAAAYAYPYTGVGVAYESFSMIDIPASRMGDVYAVYALFRRDVYRSKAVALGYELQAGFAYSNHRYDPVTNPGNVFFSFPFNFHLVAGFYSAFHVAKDWDLSVGVRFKHHSNGRLMIPNQGVNMVEAVLGGGYLFGESYTHAEYLEEESLHELDRYAEEGIVEDDRTDYLPVNLRGKRTRWVFHLYLGAGAQSTKADWMAYNVRVDDPYKKRKDFRKYPRLSLTFDVMYRYHLKHSSGLALELYYYGGLDKLKVADTELYGAGAVARGPGYDNFALGVALVHEFHYKNVSLALALGVYPYHRTGVCSPTSWNYQKAGIRWYIPGTSGLFLGYAVKANDFQESEYMELALGFRF